MRPSVCMVGPLSCLLRSDGIKSIVFRPDQGDRLPLLMKETQFGCLTD